MSGSIPSKSEHDQGAEPALIARARAGDAQAFDALVLEYQDRVFNMCYRMLANRDDALDVAQEVFLTVFRSIRRFEARARFSTWLYRITVNRCRDELRRRGSVKHTRPHSLSASEDPIEPSGHEPSPDEQASARELQALVERCIDELPGDVREVLVLRDTQDLPYEDIASVLEIPVGTVRSRLNRARTLLKERLAPILEAGS